MDRMWRSRATTDASTLRWPANGWAGGRDRFKPRMIRLHYQVRGKWIGGVMQYQPGGAWLAYDARLDNNVPGAEQWFRHRRDAKRWVECRANVVVRD